MTVFRLIAAACALLAPLADSAATTIRVHYDAGKAAIAIRGDKGPMNWDKGAPAAPGADKVWTYTWPDSLGEVQAKPTLGDDKVSIGGVYKLAAGSTVDVYPFFGAPFGKVAIVDKFASPQLGNSRKLRIYLPPSYEENKAKRYPVLYMHDGQNLFDAKTAAFGTEWGIDETMNRLIATGAIDEAIVVGIDNSPERLQEYTPCCDPKYGGGRIDTYERFIVETVKPHIDQAYRTLPGKDSTAIMGSSLGGIASIYIAQRHPQLFSKAGGVSSSFWWNKRDMIARPAARVAVKFYIDSGDREEALADSKAMRDALVMQGYKEGSDLVFHIQEGGAHNEKSWAARVDRPLTWFFPWNSTKYPGN